MSTYQKSAKQNIETYKKNIIGIIWKKSTFPKSIEHNEHKSENFKNQRAVMKTTPTYKRSYTHIYI